MALIVKDSPTPSDVHQDAPLGGLSISYGHKKKRKKRGELVVKHTPGGVSHDQMRHAGSRAQGALMVKEAVNAHLATFGFGREDLPHKTRDVTFGEAFDNIYENRPHLANSDFMKLEEDGETLGESSDSFISDLKNGASSDEVVAYTSLPLCQPVQAFLRGGYDSSKAKVSRMADDGKRGYIETSEQEIKGFAQNLQQQILDAPPLGGSRKVVRGVTGEEAVKLLRSAKQGEEVTLKGFVSASYDVSVALGFAKKHEAGSVVLNIRTKKGMVVKSTAHDTEKEIVLPHGARLKLGKPYRFRGVDVIDASYVGNDLSVSVIKAMFRKEFGDWKRLKRKKKQPVEKAKNKYTLEWRWEHASFGIESTSLEKNVPGGHNQQDHAPNKYKTKTGHARGLATRRNGGFRLIDGDDDLGEVQPLKNPHDWGGALLMSEDVQMSDAKRERELQKVDDGKPISKKELVAIRRKAIDNYNKLPKKPTKAKADRFCKARQINRGKEKGRQGGNKEMKQSDKRRYKRETLKNFGNGLTTGCTYCGARMHSQMMELEKMDPVMGYTSRDYGRSNVIPSCRGCNTKMGKKSVEEKLGIKMKRRPAQVKCKGSEAISGFAKSAFESVDPGRLLYIKGQLVDDDKKDWGGRQVTAMTYPNSIDSEDDYESKQISGPLHVFPMTNLDGTLMGYSYIVRGWAVLSGSIKEDG